MTLERKPNVLYSREEVTRRIKELGTKISNDYDGEEIVVISLLRGSFIFAADLVREISIPVNVDFMTTSSYGHGEISTGRVEIVHDVRTDVKDKNVLIVDDIMDSAHTMKHVINLIKDKDPKSIKTCVMLDKPSRREVDLTPDYVGFEIEDLFVLGYGLNYGDFYRNIPYIATFDD